MLATSCTRYRPSAEKAAVVVSAFELPKVTVPGPLTLVQVAESPEVTGTPAIDRVPHRRRVHVEFELRPVREHASCL